MIITIDEVKNLVSNLDDDDYTLKIRTQIPIIEEFITNYCNNHFTLYESKIRNDYTYFWSSELEFVSSTRKIVDNSADLNFVTDHKLAVDDNIYVKNSIKNEIVSCPR